MENEIVIKNNDGILTVSSVQVGWVIGNRKPMKDWKASVRCWLRYEA